MKKIVTKDRVISFVIGLGVGALITFGVFCLCNKRVRPNDLDNRTFNTHEKGRPSFPRNDNKQRRRDYKSSDRDNSKENDKTDETETKTENN